MSEELEQFKKQKEQQIASYPSNKELVEAANQFNVESNKALYSYNFSWMGRPIIAYPQDMIAMQEIIWEVQPDLIIETGIAHGGSIIYYASLLELIGKNGRVLGIDIDIRAHNRALIEGHPMYKRIDMIEGSSIDPHIAEQVYAVAQNYQNIMVCLDSNHTHDHVLQELHLYSKLVSKDSYCVVFDTIVEFLPTDYMPGGRPWNPGDSPHSAVSDFLKTTDHFVVDSSIDNKLLVSVAPSGYLKRIK
ncbi:MAG: cephalosporin hydroxylase family protein [Flavobacterium sp.]|uniref:cephalosporin hydroxylase family protein n=1 Tax=Flavobacterium sp. TaxID=239 RepID=UPI003BBB1EFB